jgi:hypothetical protein
MAWNNCMHYLNIKAGGKDASRSRPAVMAIDNLTPHLFGTPMQPSFTMLAWT